MPPRKGSFLVGWAGWAPPLFLVLLPLALFWPALFGRKMLWGADIQTVALPFALSARRALAAGRWPLWMPEIFCGLPGIAGSTLIFLHPLELAFHLLGLPVWRGFGIDAAAETAASGLGCYFFLRRFSLSRGAALLGAFAFAASGSQLSLIYAGHTNNLKAIAMIPWVFWGALKGGQEGRPFGPGWGLCGLALALQVLGLGLQIFAYTVPALAAFVLWSAWADAPPGARRPFGSAAGGLAFAGLVGFLLSSPQLLPTLRYEPYSWRQGFGYAQFVSWSFRPLESLTWIVPGFWGWRNGPVSWAWPSGAVPAYHGSWPFCLTTEYFGLLPWALAVAAVAAGAGSPGWRRRLRRPEFFFAGLALFSFLSGIGKYFPLHLLYFHLPGYQGFRTWTRFLCLLTFSVCALSAFGWQALAESDDFGAARRGALAFAGVALLCSAGAFWAAPFSALASSGPLTRALGPAGPASALALARSSALRSAALSCLLLAVFFGWKKLRVLGPALVLGALALHAFDVGEIPRRFLEFKAPSDVLSAPAWLAALPPARPADPFRLLDLPGVWPQNSGMLYGYETVQGYQSIQMSAPLRLEDALQGRSLDWADLLGARYILSPGPLALPSLKPLTGSPPFIYENPGALPRAFLVGASTRVPDDGAAWAALAQPGFDALHCVTVDRDLGLDGAPPEGAVRWLGRDAGSCDLQVDTRRSGLLVLSQTWYPAWTARVDGHEAELIKADGGALQAVLLGPGSHRVRLAYSPALLELGGALALLGLIALAMAGWFC